MRFLIKKFRKIYYKWLSDARNVVGSAICHQAMLLSGKGKIQFGECVVIGTVNSPGLYSGYAYIESRSSRSEIIFGDNVWTNNQLTVISDGSTISIGKMSLIGYNVSIFDSDFHELHPELRRSGHAKCAPVQIEENVWIGSNVTILKGVTIGKNSVIAPGSVVSRSIPSDVLAGGVPARVLKENISKSKDANVPL